MNRSIKIVRQLEKVFEPYRMMFKELKGKNKQLPSQYFCKEKKKSKRYRVRSSIRDFPFSREILEFNPATSEVWV
jgi:hypothetical protein